MPTASCCFKGGGDLRDARRHLTGEEIMEEGEILSLDRLVSVPLDECGERDTQNMRTERVAEEAHDRCDWKEQDEEQDERRLVLTQIGNCAASRNAVDEMRDAPNDRQVRHFDRRTEGQDRQHRPRGKAGEMVEKPYGPGIWQWVERDLERPKQALERAEKTIGKGHLKHCADKVKDQERRQSLAVDHESVASGSCCPRGPDAGAGKLRDPVRRSPSRPR
ncbi:hypothetical protein J2X08_002672 [Rhizobium rosettiformans]|nr:hypothetical protein [Rhizobium rosettiformans]MDR7065174.1 hypothetical protein [Rhizobium rosettiformans]